MMSRLLSAGCALALSIFSVAACSGGDVGSQSANVVDSFANPTEHGDLEFTASNPAEFTEEQRFHAWTFTLTDEAEVTIRTGFLTHNLGSTIYLYKKQDNGNWGSYVAKGEGEDGPEAAIERGLAAGEYRIKVKALETWQTGSFAVLGACDGAGCPAPGGGLCVGEGSTDLPMYGPYAKSCDPILQRIAVTPAAPAPADCSGKLEDRAVEMYKAYWNEVYSYEDMAGGADVEPYSDTIYKPGAGSIVRVDLDGDEDAMDFVFDAEGNLILFYQHNQSPDWGWSCPGGDTNDEEPDEDCFMSILHNADYDAASTTTGEGTAAAEDLHELAPAVAAAVGQYSLDHGLAALEPMNYSFMLWNDGYDDGAKVVVTNQDGNDEVTYVVTGDGSYGLTVAMQVDANGASFICKEH